MDMKYSVRSGMLQTPEKWLLVTCTYFLLLSYFTRALEQPEKWGQKSRLPLPKTFQPLRLPQVCTRKSGPNLFPIHTNNDNNVPRSELRPAEHRLRIRCPILVYLESFSYILPKGAKHCFELNYTPLSFHQCYCQLYIHPCSKFWYIYAQQWSIL